MSLDTKKGSERSLPLPCNGSRDCWTMNPACPPLWSEEQFGRCYQHIFEASNDANEASFFVVLLRIVSFPYASRGIDLENKAANPANSASIIGMSPSHICFTIAATRGYFRQGRPIVWTTKRVSIQRESACPPRITL
jgi:hypothetical protein